MPAEFFKELAGSPDMRVWIAGIDDGSVADNVVGEDECSGAGELDGPVQVVGVVGLVGVQEDKVEGCGLLGIKGGEGIERRADADVDERRDAGTVEVGARYGRVFLLQLERDQATIRGKRSRKPEGRVSAKRADLQNAPRALDAGKEVKHLALIGGDVDRRKACAGVSFQRIVHAVVGWKESLGEIAVHSGPAILIHRG